MNQVESRPLRHFVAVAHELSFARAAERLRISAPALSRTVAQLETQLGVRLLERSTRHVALTDAGNVLLDQAQIALDALARLRREARRVACDHAKRLIAAEEILEDLVADLAGWSRDDDHVARRWPETPGFGRTGSLAAINLQA